MTRSSPSSFASLLFVCAACAGDGDVDSTPPSADEYDDLAQAVGTSVARNTAGDAATLADATTISLGVLPVGFTADGAGVIGGSRFGFSYRYTLACEDTAGQQLDHCGHDTSRAEVDVAWSGEVDLPRLQAAADRTASWVIDDLELDLARADGDSTLALDLAVQPADREPRTYHFDYAAAYDGLQIVVDDRRLVGGTIRYAISGAKTVGDDLLSSFEVDGELVIQPTGRALLTLDGEHQYDVDLSTGVVIRL